MKSSIRKSSISKSSFIISSIRNSSIQSCKFSSLLLSSISPSIPLTYSSVYSSFKFNIPEYFNIGTSIDKHASTIPDKIGLLYYNNNKEYNYTFKQIKIVSDQIGLLINSLLVDKLKPEVVGIYLSQSPITLLSHLSIFKTGNISLPLFTQFGVDALKHRLYHSEAKILFIDESGVDVIYNLIPELPELKHIIVIPNNYIIGYSKYDRNSSSKLPDKCIYLPDLLDKVSSNSVFNPVNTKSDDPALLIYTSGTTGNPKGCLHGHRVLLGHLPGVELPHNFFPKDKDLMWTPADWAWIGGLLDALLPALYHGIPVLAYRMKKFDPEEAFYMMKKFNVKNTFLPPTALKMMRSVDYKKFNLQLRSVGSGGESLGGEILEWGKSALGCQINEFYGQTECNLVLSNSNMDAIKPGSMGKAVPGHIVRIVDDNGDELPDGQVGNIGVKMPDPVAFLHYFKNPEATKSKVVNNWLLMGDLAKRDSDGYFFYFGRDDDVIKSSGYRIGPAEIENCILKHKSVVMCAVVGKPDDKRGDIVKAFVVLKSEVRISDHETIKIEIANIVKTTLAHYEYPREIEFVKELPMTTTGKIIRKDLRKLEVDRTANNKKL